MVLVSTTPMGVPNFGRFSPKPPGILNMFTRVPKAYADLEHSRPRLFWPFLGHARGR